jgi:type IV pilus assembly protein PilO
MNKTRQWAMLTAVACLAVLAAGWFVVVKPQRSHAASLRSQAADVDSSNDRLRTQVDQLRQQQRNLPEQQKTLSQIATKIPDNPALPALIRQLSAAADGAGVTLVSLAPSTPTVATPAAGAAGVAGAGARPVVGAAAAPTAAGPTLANIPIVVQVQGSYFNIEQFFSAVEGLNRAMLVNGFTMTPASGTGATSSTGASGGAGSSVAGAPQLPPGTLNAQINATVFEAPVISASATSLTSTTPVR